MSTAPITPKSFEDLTASLKKLEDDHGSLSARLSALKGLKDEDYKKMRILSKLAPFNPLANRKQETLGQTIYKIGIVIARVLACMSLIIPAAVYAYDLIHIQHKKSLDKKEIALLEGKIKKNNEDKNAVKKDLAPLEQRHSRNVKICLGLTVAGLAISYFVTAAVRHLPPFSTNSTTPR
jgi:hypothetical protein